MLFGSQFVDRKILSHTHLGWNHHKNREHWFTPMIQQKQFLSDSRKPLVLLGQWYHKRTAEVKMLSLSVLIIIKNVSYSQFSLKTPILQKIVSTICWEFILSQSYAQTFAHIPLCYIEKEARRTEVKQLTTSFHSLSSYSQNPHFFSANLQSVSLKSSTVMSSKVSQFLG